MKRVAVNSNQSHFVGEEACAVNSNKKKRLIEEYLEVQKEFVLKKKKLQMAKQKREILLAEVRKSLGENWNHGFNEASPNILPPVYIAHPILGYEDQDSEKKTEDGLNSLRVEKKRKNHSITEKRVGKKKISWQEQVASKV